MTQDPAFGLLLAVPISLISAGAAIAMKPGRRLAAIFAGVAALGFVVGCGRSPAGDATSKTTSTTTAAATSAPQHPATQARMLTAFSSSDAAAARVAQKSGSVSIDQLRADPGGPVKERTSITLKRGQTLSVVGWAFAGSGTPCHAVGLIFDGRKVFAGEYGDARPDVAAFYKDSSRTNVGYVVAVPASHIGSGRHRAYVVCVDPDGSAHSSYDSISTAVQ